MSLDDKKILLTTRNVRPDSGRYATKYYYLLCCPLLAPQITGILWPVPSPAIVNSSWQSKPVSSIVVAPASRLNDSKSSRKLHTPENYKKSHQYLTNVQCWNRRNHGQTIHPTVIFISINFLQMPCEIT